MQTKTKTTGEKPLALQTTKDERAIKIKGFVEVLNGDTHFTGENKATSNLLKTIASFLASDSGYYTNSTAAVALPSYQWSSRTTFMVIGSDQSTVTTESMQNLVTPIGTSPGTKPNSQAFATSNPSTGVWRITYTATWNAGTVTGTIGEIGLFLYGFTALQAAGTGYSNYNMGLSVIMTNRLAVANSDFTAFAINNTVPLVIAWTLQFSF
jgi:hypothetical protein